MTSEETIKFCDKAFVAFPGLKDWIRGLQTESGKFTGGETMATWARTLKGVEFHEAMEVLESWIDCTLPEPPVGYRRETFAIDVRSIVMRRRTDRLAETHSEREREEQWRKTNRGNYQPSAAFRSIAKPFNEILAARAKFMNGEISGEECEQQEKQIIERAFA